MSVNIKSLFQDQRVVYASAVVCCMLWGSSYPAIKIGYQLLTISRDDVASQLLFAGWRFVIAGVLLSAFARAIGKPVLGFTGNQAKQIVGLGLVQTAIQYVFFYIGLAHATGVKSSIMNATGAFFSVVLAHFLFRNDKLTRLKIMGCLTGFAGVMVVNFQPGGMGLDMSFLGEGFVVIAAFILSAASIYGKKLSQTMDVIVMTGWQLGIGGAILAVSGMIFGGHFPQIGFEAMGLWLYMGLLSAVSFALWSLILKYNPVSMVAPFNFLIPVFGVLMSAVFLGETILEWKNAVSLVLVCAGIWLVTRSATQRPTASVDASGVKAARL